MVVGAGIAGIQASLDLADSGYKVYLVESGTAIGGHMAQLDKTFPTNDCAMCTISPRLVAAGTHRNIDIITNAELTEQVIKLTEKVAKLSKNSSNSSKPPSSDIVKPPKTPKSKGPHRQGGQPGHTGVNRQPFSPEQIKTGLLVSEIGRRVRVKRMKKFKPTLATDATLSFEPSLMILTP